MTYLGQENNFVKSQYSLTLFEAHFRHSLGALSACNAFFEFLCCIFAFQKFFKFTCCLGKKSLSCPKCTDYVPFYSHCMCAEAVMLIFDKNQPDLQLSSYRVFLFSTLTSFQSSYKMTIKPINRTIGGTIICRFTPWYYIVDQK